MVAKVEFESVVVFVAFETHWASKFSSREIVFERGKEVKVESNWHVGG